MTTKTNVPAQPVMEETVGPAQTATAPTVTVEPNGNGQSAPAAPHQGTRFLIVTDNPAYDGKVFGVPIYKGVGRLDALSLDAKLGHGLAEILTELGQWKGYTVMALGPEQSVEDAIFQVRRQQAVQQSRIEELITMLSDANVAARVREAIEYKRA